MLPIAKQINLPDRAACAADRHRRVGNDQERDRSPFGRLAQLRQMRKRRRLGERLAPRGHLVVPRRRAILAPLGDRLERIDLVRDLTRKGQESRDQVRDVWHRQRFLIARDKDKSVVFPESGRLRSLNRYQAIRADAQNREASQESRQFERKASPALVAKSAIPACSNQPPACPRLC